MVNYSTNINKTINHLSPQIIEYKKKTNTTYDVSNPGPGLGQVQKGGRVKPNPPHLDIFIRSIHHQF